MLLARELNGTYRLGMELERRGNKLFKSFEWLPPDFDRCALDYGTWMVIPEEEIPLGIELKPGEGPVEVTITGIQKW